MYYKKYLPLKVLNVLEHDHIQHTDKNVSVCGDDKGTD